MNRLKVDFNAPGRICVVRTDKLGDMTLTLPLCRALKEEFPNAKISIIASSYVEPLLIESPAVDEAFYIDKEPGGIESIFKREKFDIAFFPRPRLHEALAAFKARIPLRVGSAYRLYSFLFNHKVYDHRKTAERHEAEYNVRLAEELFGRKFDVRLVEPYVQPQALSEVNSILAERGFFGKRFIVIHPCSGGSSRDWPIENFAKAAKLLNENEGYNIVITGAPNEAKSCAIVAAECPAALDLSGKLSLPELIALISRSSLLAANSTGTLHIAAALGKQVVGFYPNSPAIGAKRWGPYTDKKITLSPPPSADPELNDDMTLIPVEAFVEAIKKLSDPLNNKSA